MKDDLGDGCGYKVRFRGWPNRACLDHDEAYLENSDAQKWLSRADVDKALLRDLLRKSRTGNFRVLKAAASFAMYGFVRAVGGLFWEGDG